MYKDRPMSQHAGAQKLPEGLPLKGRRLFVCGKGGSGKSTLVALLAAVMQRRGYQVLVLDGDASNPEGLIRLLFGLGVEAEPRPLVEFFGGIERVTCPVDDPSPLTRIGDARPVSEKRVDVSQEIPPEYYLRKDKLLFMQAGKIAHYGQGCDGPLEKVVRDFRVSGEAVSLVDMKAGVEHFGRKVPNRDDLILGVVDYTLESVSIAERIEEFCREAGIGDFYLVLNKIGSAQVESVLRDRLAALQQRVVGTLSFDQDLIMAGLSGKALGDCRALAEVGRILERLEQAVAAHGPGESR